MKRMNLGCGPVQPFGWDNVDALVCGQPYKWNPANSPLGQVRAVDHPFGWETWNPTQGEYDLIVVNHVIQHVYWTHQHAFLSNCYAALKPGGVLRVLCPDVRGAFGAYERGDKAWFPISDDEIGFVRMGGIDAKLCAYLTQCSANLTVHTPAFLGELMMRAKFTEATEVEWGESVLPAEYEPCSLDSREAESFVIEARR